MVFVLVACDGGGAGCEWRMVVLVAGDCGGAGG